MVVCLLTNHLHNSSGRRGRIHRKFLNSPRQCQCSRIPWNILQSSFGSIRPWGIVEQEGDEVEIECVVGTVLNTMLSEVEGSCDQKPILNRSLMRRILECYGEESPSEADINGMLSVFGPPEDPLDGSVGKLDVRMLLHAITRDLEAYNPSWETRQSVHYDDVFQDTPLDQHSMHGSFSGRMELTKSGSSRSLKDLDTTFQDTH